MIFRKIGWLKKTENSYDVCRNRPRSHLCHSCEEENCFLASLLADNSKILVANIASSCNFVLDLTVVIGLVHVANGAQWTSPITSQPHSLNGLSALRVRTKRRYDLCPVLFLFTFLF